jgi:hypothetical protein
MTDSTLCAGIICRAGSDARHPPAAELAHACALCARPAQPPNNAVHGPAVCCRLCAATAAAGPLATPSAPFAFFVAANEALRRRHAAWARRRGRGAQGPQADRGRRAQPAGRGGAGQDGCWSGPSGRSKQRGGGGVESQPARRCEPGGPPRGQLVDGRATRGVRGRAGGRHADVAAAAGARVCFVRFMATRAALRCRAARRVSARTGGAGTRGASRCGAATRRATHAACALSWPPRRHRASHHR